MSRQGKILILMKIWDSCQIRMMKMSNDRCPPFNPLSKYRLSNLTKEQRKTYLDEIDYRRKIDSEETVERGADGSSTSDNFIS